VSDIDPIAFGRLEQSVTTLTTSVDKLTNRIDEMEQKMSVGRGIAIGLLLVSGSLGAAAHSVIEHWLSK
jgi:hypothetical protein